MFIRDGFNKELTRFVDALDKLKHAYEDHLNYIECSRIIEVTSIKYISTHSLYSNIGNTLKRC